MKFNSEEHTLLEVSAVVLMIQGVVIVNGFSPPSVFSMAGGEIFSLSFKLKIMQ